MGKAAAFLLYMVEALAAGLDGLEQVRAFRNAQTAVTMQYLRGLGASPESAAEAVAVHTDLEREDFLALSKSVLAPLDEGALDRIYAEVQIRRVQAGEGGDVRPPLVPGDEGGMRLVVIPRAGLEISWEPSVDDRTPAELLAYRLVVSLDGDDVSSVSAIRLAPSSVVYAEGVAVAQPVVVSGLAEGRTYHVGLIVSDQSGQTSLYGARSAFIPDRTPPFVESGLHIDEIQATSVRLSWEEPFDLVSVPEDVQVKIVSAFSPAFIDTIEKVEVQRDVFVIQEFARAVSPFSVFGLNEASSYSFAALFRDSAGNVSLVGPVTIETPDVTPPQLQNEELTLVSATDHSVSFQWEPATDSAVDSSELLYKVVCADSVADLQSIASADAQAGHAIVSDYKLRGISFVEEVSGLEEGQVISCTVIVKDPAGNRARYRTLTQSTHDLTPPVPGGDLLISSIETDSFVVEWPAAEDLVTNGSDLHYRVVVSRDLGPDSTLQEALNVPLGDVKQEFVSVTEPLRVSGLLEGTDYGVAVLVRDTSLNTSLYPLRAVTTRDGTAPVVGSAMRVLAVSEGAVTFAYCAAVDNVTGEADLEYLVVRSETAASLDSVSDITSIAPSQFVRDWGPWESSVTVNSLAAGSHQCFQVAVRDTSGNVSIHTPLCTTTVPSFPSNVAAVGTVAGVRVNWDNVSGAESFKVYWGTESGVGLDDAHQVSINAEIELLGLDLGIPYYFRITAVSEGGESALSPEVVAVAGLTELTSYAQKPTDPELGSKIFYSASTSRYWTFYSTGSGVAWAWLVDRENWSQSGILLGVSERFAVHYTEAGASPSVFLAEERDGGIFLRKGGWQSGNLSFVELGFVFQSQSTYDDYIWPALSVSSSGYLWLAAFFRHGGAGYTGVVIRSSSHIDGDLSAWEGRAILGTPSSMKDSIHILPQDDDKMLAVIGFQTVVRAYQFDSGVWSEAHGGGTKGWSLLGDAYGMYTDQIAVVGPEVYHAANASHSSNEPVLSRLSKWDGHSWKPLGQGINGGVTALAVVGRDLYVGGSFTNAGGHPTADYLARWDGWAWHPVAASAPSSPKVIVVEGSSVFLGGSFVNAAGLSAADYIVEWDGSSWKALGSGLSATVNTAIWHDGALIVGGSFVAAGSDPQANYIARWDGSSWSSVGGGLNATVLGLGQSSEGLLAGGDFTDAGGDADADFLYAGGAFLNAGGNSAMDLVARWNGTSWLPMGGGLDGACCGSKDVFTLLATGTEVFSSGYFRDGGGNPAIDNFARWNGSGWSALGGSPGASASASSMTQYGSEIIMCGGYFDLANNGQYQALVKYNGAFGLFPGGGIAHATGDNRCYGVHADGSDLYVVGKFWGMNSVPDTRNIARWDGANWHSLGKGVPYSGPTPSFVVSASGKAYVAGGVTGEFSLAVAGFADNVRAVSGVGETLRTLRILGLAEH